MLQRPFIFRVRLLVGELEVGADHRFCSVVGSGSVFCIRGGLARFMDLRRHFVAGLAGHGPPRKQDCIRKRAND
jgi:hypothetical protein